MFPESLSIVHQLYVCVDIKRTLSKKILSRTCIIATKCSYQSLLFTNKLFLLFSVPPTNSSGNATNTTEPITPLPGSNTHGNYDPDSTVGQWDQKGARSSASATAGPFCSLSAITLKVLIVKLLSLCCRFVYQSTNLIDLWVIMILCALSTSTSSELRTKRSKNMRKVCLFLVQLSRLYDYQTWKTEIHEVRKGLWAFFLDCAFRMLIGWAGRLRSRGRKWPKQEVT